MFYCKIAAGQYVFKQGDNASSYFILEKGALEVSINDKVVKNLKSGDGFGELALLYSAPRSASIKATENCTFWAIDRNTFKKAIGEMITKEYDENRKFIEAVKFFSNISYD
jgi:cGMP-dependent protein kinase